MNNYPRRLMNTFPLGARHRFSEILSLLAPYIGMIALLTTAVMILPGCGKKNEEKTVQEQIDLPGRASRPAANDDDEQVPGDDAEPASPQPVKKSKKELEKKRKQEEVEKRFQELLKKRLEEAKAEVPKFNRQEELRKLFGAKYRIDITKLSRDFKTIEEVDTYLEQKIEEKARIQFSEDRRMKIVLEARKEFPLYQVGDTVEISTLRGKISGVIEGIYADRVKVGRLSALLTDIHSPPPECFFEERCIKRREHYVRVNFDVQKDDYKRELVKKVREKMYKKQGFLKEGNKWVNVDQIIKDKFEAKINDLEKKFNEKQLKELQAQVEKQLRLEMAADFAQGEAGEIVDNDEPEEVEEESTEEYEDEDVFDDEDETDD